MASSILRNFLTRDDIKELVQAEDFDTLYKRAGENKVSTTELTDFLVTDCDVDPLDYLTTIPDLYASYLDIEDIYISRRITSIGVHAFDGCEKLKRVFIESGGVKHINTATFAHCSSLSTVTLPEGLESIANDAFMGCKSLERIEIPESCEIIEHTAFKDCTALTRVDISPDTVVKPTAFSGCTKLQVEVDGCLYTDVYNNPYYMLSSTVDKDKQEYNIHPDCYMIGTSAFNKCDKVDTIDASGVTKFEYGAFSNCGAKKIILPAWIGTVPPHFCYGCTRLESINLEGADMIEIKAFQKCTSLKSVELSNSIRTIDGWAFYLCDSLKDIYFDGTKEEWSSINFGPRWLTTECIIHCKDGDVIVNEDA